MTKHEIAFQMTRDIIEEYRNINNDDTKQLVFKNHADDFFVYLYDNFPLEENIDKEQTIKDIRSVMQEGNSITKGNLTVDENISSAVFVTSLLRYILYTSNTRIITGEDRTDWIKLAKLFTPFVMDSLD